MSLSQFSDQFELRKLYRASVTQGDPRRIRGTWWTLAKPVFLWCPSCNRTYRNGLFRLRGDEKTCPYHDCKSAEGGARGWEEVRSRESEARLPSQPMHGVIYPSSLKMA